MPATSIQEFDYALHAIPCCRLYMVQASTGAFLFLAEVIGLCTCSPQELFPGIGQARIETNLLLIVSSRGKPISRFAAFPSCPSYSTLSVLTLGGTIQLPWPVRPWSITFPLLGSFLDQHLMLHQWCCPCSGIQRRARVDRPSFAPAQPGE